MNKALRRVLLAVVAVWLVAGAVQAADKTYQVTGPVLELTDDTIVVQKGHDRWVIYRDKDTKVTGELKVGAKVTIEYTMKAATVTVKETKETKAGK